jgi:hypothetical protein
VPRNAHRGGEHETLDNNNERARYQKRPARHRRPLRQTDETAHEQTGVRQGSWQTDLGLQVVFSSSDVTSFPLFEQQQQLQQLRLPRSLRRTQVESLSNPYTSPFVSSTCKYNNTLFSRSASRIRVLAGTLVVLGVLFVLGQDHAHADVNDVPPLSEQVVVAPSPSQVISDAQSAIDTATATVSTVTQNSLSLTDTSTVTPLINSANAAIDSATAVVSAVQPAVEQHAQAQANVYSANAVLDDKTQVKLLAQSAVDTATVTLAVKTQLVDSQTIVVANDQALVDSTTAVVSANTTPGLNLTVYSSPGTGGSPTQGTGTVVYTGIDANGVNEQWNSSGPTVNGATTTTTITETFAGNRLNTTIGITVNGTPVTTTNNNGVYIGSIGFPGPGQDPSLSFYSSTADAVVTLPSNTTTASFHVFAKNGDSVGTVTYSDGTTSTFTIQHNVSSEYQSYVHQEVITAPAGKTISTIKIPANSDYYAVDNVAATTQVTSTTTVSDDFQVRWQGVWTPQYTGTQYIFAPADDGVRLYLDGELVIDDWFDKGGGGSTADVGTVAGVSKTFDMWYYENGGGAAVSLQRFTGSGWEVLPSSEFSTTTASPQQVTAMNNAQATLAASTALLTTYTSEKNTAQSALTSAQQTLATATTNFNNAQTAANSANATLIAKDAALVSAVSAVAPAISAMNTAVSQAQTAFNNQLRYEAAISNTPSNLTAVLENGQLVLRWEAPAVQPIAVERYAIMWTSFDAGWGIATGNVGDINALTTEIAIPIEVVNQAGPGEYVFSIRSDNDSLAVYSNLSNTVTVDTTPPPPPAPAPAPAPEPVVIAPEPEPEPEPEVVEPTPEPEVITPEPEPEPEPEPTPEPEPEPTPTQEVDNALDDGKITASELNDITDSMAADGEVSAKETEQLVEALSADGKLTTSEVESVLDALAGDGEVSKEDVAAIVALVSGDGKLSEGEKDIVADALVEQFSGEKGVDVNAVKDAGIDLADLPKETPIELNNGVVITAEVGNAFEALADPSELVGAVFTDPDLVLTALTNLGADMSEEVRETSEEVVVASVIAGGVVVQAAAAAAATATSTSGTNSGGGPVQREDGTKRRAVKRKPTKKTVKKQGKIRPTRRPK